MKPKEIAESLQLNEIKVLRALKEHGANIQELARKSGLSADAVRRAVLWLKNKGLVKEKVSELELARISDLGKNYIGKTLPERRLLEVLVSPIPIADARAKSALNAQEFSYALGWLKKTGAIAIKDGKIHKLADIQFPQEKLFQLLARGPLELAKIKDKEILANLRARGLVEIERRKVHNISLTELGKRVVRFAREEERIGQLTPELILSGKWKKKKFRRYDVTAPVPAIWPGKKQAYLAFLDEVKDILVGMGFKEMVGPLVELELFNCDGLYMPQDHPARGIHDMYFLEQPKYGDLKSYKKLVERVKAAHERGLAGSCGWRQKFDVRESAKLILRSQTTAVSARMLASPDLKIPGKYFTIGRVFRPEKIDATHLTEFLQLEGIVLGEDVNFRNLLGMMRDFALQVAKTDKIKFSPVAYFPFTEPSVTAYIYHPKLQKWLEVMPGGIFRPEVTAIYGIEVPVLAWGFGIDRLFMIREGISDIRTLFSDDLSWLREAKL